MKFTKKLSASRTHTTSDKLWTVVLSAPVIVAVLYCLISWDFSLLTPDQKGYRFFVREDYQQAAANFADPMWKGTALFRQGQFEEAAGVFAGDDSAQGAFNEGNALVMQGKYEKAVGQYGRALALSPGWEDAMINREIALARAEMLKEQGGDMTGGKMGADDIVFSETKPPPSAGEEQVLGEQPSSEAELREVWLRQVQTKPADFLRAKFAYQHAIKDSEQ